MSKFIGLLVLSVISRHEIEEPFKSQKAKAFNLCQLLIYSNRTRIRLTFIIDIFLRNMI